MSEAEVSGQPACVICKERCLVFFGIERRRYLIYEIGFVGSTACKTIVKGVGIHVIVFFE